MGSSQMLASKNSQENDYSASGLSLQRKAIAMQSNSNVMQRMAWVATKPLDALSKDNDVSDTVDLNMDEDKIEKSQVGKGGKRKKFGYNSHIILGIPYHLNQQMLRLQ